MGKGMKRRLKQSTLEPSKAHRAYYSAIERGERNLTLGTLHRVAKGLGVRMADLMRDCNI
jgi:transcriptional regulator with XRE-family HTH domain